MKPGFQTETALPTVESHLLSLNLNLGIFFLVHETISAVIFLVPSRAQNIIFKNSSFSFLSVMKSRTICFAFYFYEALNNKVY